MKLLDRVQRPVVVFDPANSTHRQLYRTFLDTNSWNHSPIRFDLHEDFLELPYYLNKVLVDYYMGLDKDVKKTRVKPKVKAKPKAQPDPETTSM